MSPSHTEVKPFRVTGTSIDNCRSIVDPREGLLANAVIEAKHPDGIPQPFWVSAEAVTAQTEEWLVARLRNISVGKEKHVQRAPLEVVRVWIVEHPEHLVVTRSKEGEAHKDGRVRPGSGVVAGLDIYQVARCMQIKRFRI